MGRPARSRPALAALALALSACAPTQQTRSVDPAGFLGDYSLLSPGREGQALLVFVDPAADFSRYDKLLLDPVTLWGGPDSRLDDVPREELKHLADALETALRRELAHAFELVDRPQPGTLRLRTAITEARKSKVVLDVVSTVLPPARLLSGVDRLATGTHSFVGRAAIEGEVLDALSHRRLVAFVDERAGGKTLKGSTSAWSDVYAAFDYWAEVLATRLAFFHQFDSAAEAMAPTPQPE